MKRLALFIVTFLLLKGIFSASAQNFQTIDVTQGLSDRRVFSIQKDHTGYMWFLTYAGIDRFDGKIIKHYSLSSGKGFIDSYSENNILKTDSRGIPWLITPSGETFVFNQINDEFQLIEQPQEMRYQTFDLVELTEYDEIWYCNKEYLYIYDIPTNKIRNIKLIHYHSRITSVLQTDESSYIIGTNEGICQAKIINNTLTPKKSISDNFFSPELLFYHSQYKQLFAGSDNHGLLIYDLELEQVKYLYKDFEKTPVSAIRHYGDSEVLIATQGSGLYKYHLKDETLTPYLKDYTKQVPITNNNIRTIYLDEEERIWMSVYPIGIAIYNRHSPQYKWIRHHDGNTQSLGDDQVNYIIEDTEGDIWYATNNGISLYRRKTDEWQHLFTEEKEIQTSAFQQNATFLSLCEIRPGYILAGGYMSGIYGIDKKTMNSKLITPHSINKNLSPFIPNKYIRTIYQDKDGYIWTGGHNYLGCSNKNKNFFEYYPVEHPITCILEKDSTSLFVGTGFGIYLFNKKEKTFSRLRMPFASQFINTLYKHSNGVLYIGTTNSGLIALHPNGEFEIFAYRNSSLISDNVYCIVPYGKDQLIISTEKTLAKFYIKEKKIKNWTVDNGLISTNFNPRAGIHTSNQTFIFGTARGAIEYNEKTKIAQRFKTKIRIDRIYIDHQDFDHELQKRGYNSLDSLKVLHLSHDQNMFTIQLSAINYDTPNHTIIRWRINEINEFWKKIPSNGKIEKNRLKPGKYTLQIQALAEDNLKVFDSKKLEIIISPPFWETPKAIILYLIIIVAIIFFLIRVSQMRKQQVFSKKKTEYFINSAIKLRAPIQLIKAPLKEILLNKQLNQQDTEHLQTALRNCDNLDFTVSNIINTEKSDSNENVQVSNYQLNTLIQQYIKQVLPLTHSKEITILYDETTNITNEVWIDKNKIDIIFFNILSHIIKNIPSESIIHIDCKINNKYWITQIYSGNKEEDISTYKKSLIKRLFAKRILKKKYIDTKDIEVQIIHHLAKSHRGKASYLSFSSTERSFELMLPLNSSKYKLDSPVNSNVKTPNIPSNNVFLQQKQKKEKEFETHYKGRVLIVGNNEEENLFLETVLSNEWETIVSYSGKIALLFIQEKEPDIIISDSYIPDMPIDNFCEMLKSNIKTSHIPILLLTSMNDNESIIHNFDIKADHYISKPFDISLLKAILSNTLANQTLLKKKLVQTDIIPRLEDIKTNIKENEHKFLSEVKSVIEEHIYDKNFTIDSLCRLIGMSRSSLYSKIKNITGQPLNEIIRNIKLQKASELLLSKEHNIMEVSDMLGFSEPKYFRIVFKKYFGFPPSEYIRIKTEEKDTKRNIYEIEENNE